MQVKIIMLRNYQTHNTEETKQIARSLAANAQAGGVYALVGDLGVGKTVFSKGFAEGLGISEPVTSPTFTIVGEYDGGKLPFYHFDVYRIENPEELDEVGLTEYLYGEGVCLIEWADRIEELLPEETVWIRIEKDLPEEPDRRRITIGIK